MGVETISDGNRVARKHHTCFHCSGTIAPGDIHRVGTFKYDDHVYTLRTHHDCDQLWAEYETAAGLSWWDFEEGYPPLIDEWREGGCFDELCSDYRGMFPGPVTRMEYRDQIAEIKWADRAATTEGL